jgi:FKBP-type peptidyl-prolyl cis-trans isomerase FkpA
MKKYFLLFSVLIIGLSSCQKTSVATQAAVDDTKIQAYIKANNITATKDPSGIYYQVIRPGTGPYPTSTDTVQIAYTGKYLNDQQFATAPTTDMAVSGLVPGFQTGMQHINAGGRLLLIIPSALGYGTAGTGSGGVAPNAVLVYTIDLISFY